MAKPKVTIIVATYNNEKYLKRCLDSLIKQSLKEIEIIVVNDGSTDKTSSILSSYATGDSRITVINQENQKQGAARNRGLEIATGEFITFVDSDDWIDENYCEKLYNATVRNNVNMAIGSITRDYPHKVKKLLTIEDEKLVFGTNKILDIISWHVETANKLYKTSLISDLRFTEGVYFEDAPYSLEAIIKEKSLVTVPGTCYHYFSNPKSTIKTGGNIAKQNDKIEMNLKFYDIAKKNNVNIAPHSLVYKERHLLYTIKHYIDGKDYYILGIKIFSKKIPYDNSKVFLVIDTGCLDNIFHYSSLCKNTKRIFPESKIVFIVRPEFKDVTLTQDYIDDVIVYDKHDSHKGLNGIIKFTKNFKYKNIYASFIANRNFKNILMAKFLKSKFIAAGFYKQQNSRFTNSQYNELLRPFTNRNIS